MLRKHGRSFVPLFGIGWVIRVTVKRFAGAALLLISIFAGWAPARGGHGVVDIPSFYPQEITIETLDPASAAAQFEKNTLHVYLGSRPRFAGSVPGHLKSVESLDAFLVLTFNPASEAFKQAESRCGAARGILAALVGDAQDVVFSPYPVTSYHPDYLQHLDRIKEAKARAQAQSAINLALKFRARGEHAEALVRSRWKLNHDNWDVSLEEVAVNHLMSSSGARLNGWLGPPWMKEGWFHAYRLLASVLSDPDEQRVANTIYRRLVRGEDSGLTERLNLERRLIANLTRSCERVVVGYTLRREYYNDSFSEGVENIAFDSQLGMNSPVFVRTVKLKDFPWNGWLRLGINKKPEAAWNPVAGFTDAVGRLMWSTLGDSALLPLPYNGSWIPNRIDPSVADGTDSQGFQVPAVAVIPQAGTGGLQPVGKGTVSGAKIVYRVQASLFHDGTETEVADLLYPYILAYRWGVKVGDADRAYDPAIEAATALMRERLVGVRVVRVARKIKEIAPDIKVLQQTPVIEVYVNYLAPDSLQVAALAPPWSTVPWHLLALMEEAVQRGFAAFSKEEAERQKVAWLDLARDRSLRERLSALVNEFERNGYRPAALRDRVTAEAARLRWRALKKFAESRGHLLVTNGPYRLKKWSDHSSVFQVVRELTYPWGIGSFDRYAYPPRAVITQMKREANRVLIDVDVEKVVKVQRTHTIVRERLKRQAMRGFYRIRLDSRYVVVAPDGSVVGTGTARWDDEGRFVADLPERLPRGRYTFLVAIYLDGNSVNPATGILSFEAT
ncbi:MAG: hypothetical protein ACE5JN_06025 [Candidatus Methylomirabilia bacterium]